MKRLPFALFLATAIAGLAWAEPMDFPANQSSLYECEKVADCACVLSPDHCGFLPKSGKAVDQGSAERLQAGKIHPACFGPHRYAIPECQQGKCVCRDGGKAPD